MTPPRHPARAPPVRLASHRHTRCHGACPAHARARADQRALELRQTTQHGEHQPSMRGGRIRPCVAKRAEARLAFGDRGKGVLRRSRVERAKRSSRVTIDTSSASSWASTLRTWARSLCAPLAVSRNIFTQPAWVSALTCPSRSDRPWIPVHSRKSWLSYAPKLCTRKTLWFQCAASGAEFLINAKLSSGLYFRG